MLCDHCGELRWWDAEGESAFCRDEVEVFHPARAPAKLKRLRRNQAPPRKRKLKSVA